LLIEEQRTNLNVRSEELGNAAYSSQGLLPVISNVSMAPDGNTSADRIVENTSNGIHRLFTTVFNATSGTTYTASVFAKSDGRRYLYLNAGSPFNAQATFDLQNGVISGAGVGSSSITRLVNGWYRCSVTGTATVTSAAVVSLHINNTVSTAFDDIYTGDGTSGLLLWGAQVEVGAFPTSYIPTTIGPATRSADVCSITGGDFSGFYNQPEGTFFASAMIANLVGENRGIAQIDNGDNLHHIRIVYGNTNGGFHNSVRANDASNQLGNNAGSANVSQKLIISYQGTSYAGTVNGATVTTTTRTQPTGLSTLRIGSLAGPFYTGGHIAAIRFYKKRLPNSKLQALTAP
jgi:hypothetical protein